MRIQNGVAKFLQVNVHTFGALYGYNNETGIFDFISGENIEVMAIPFVEFSGEENKNRKDFVKKSIEVNHCILQIGVIGMCRKVPRFDFQSQFSTSKII